jgi:periodic tryptophan protein 2
MLDFKFTNLFGITYNSGNIQFSKSKDNLLYAPIGNKVTLYDIKYGAATTIDIQTRSNISLIEVTKKGLLIAVDVEGYCILANIKKNIVIGFFNFHEKISAISSSPCGNYLCVGIKNGVQLYRLPQVLIRQIEPLVLLKSYTALHFDKV